MSFIPSKLGLRTHLLTQINLALIRVAVRKIYAQFAALISDPNYGPSVWAGELNKRDMLFSYFSVFLQTISRPFYLVEKNCEANTLTLSLDFTGLGSLFMDH